MAAYIYSIPTDSYVLATYVSNREFHIILHYEEFTLTSLQRRLVIYPDELASNISLYGGLSL